MISEEWSDERYREHRKNLTRKFTLYGLFLGPISALGHAFAGDGESSFGSALLLVLGASALGAVLAFIGGGMGGFVGSYFARRGDRKRRH